MKKANEQNTELYRSRIKKAMAYKNLRNCDLVRNGSIDRSTLSQYLSGNGRNLTTDKVRQIYDETFKDTDVREEYLLGIDDYMTKKDYDMAQGISERLSNIVTSIYRSDSCLQGLQLILEPTGYRIEQVFITDITPDKGDWNEKEMNEYVSDHIEYCVFSKDQFITKITRTKLEELRSNLANITTNLIDMMGADH